MARDDPNIETQLNEKARYEAKTEGTEETQRVMSNVCRTGGVGGVEERRTEETEDEKVKALSSEEEDEPQVMDGGNVRRGYN